MSQTYFYISFEIKLKIWVTSPELIIIPALINKKRFQRFSLTTFNFFFKYWKIFSFSVIQ